MTLNAYPSIQRKWLITCLPFQLHKAIASNQRVDIYYACVCIYTHTYTLSKLLFNFVVAEKLG